MLTGSEVVKATAEFLQMMIDGQAVFMRESDRMINATQILKLSTLTQNQQTHRIKALKCKYKVQHLPAWGLTDTRTRG